MLFRYVPPSVWAALFLTCPCRAGGEPGDKKLPIPSVNQLEELLTSGKYRDVPRGRDAASKAIWAFAAYHLAPNKEVYDAAWEAHQQGDLLGSFIVMRCHDEGRAVRRDENLLNQLNFKLRETLSKKAKRSSLELYILSRTSNANIAGRVGYPKEGADKLQKAEQEQGEAWLLAAAEQGFAQAAIDLGNKAQKDMEYRKAWNWYDKAAKKGSAEAWRCKGYFFMEGLGVPRNRDEGYTETLEAAERGDAFAMVSMAIYLDNGWGTRQSPTKAAAWMEKAAQTGHWVGLLEKAQAHWRGMHGLEKDANKAQTAIRQALQTCNREVLEILTSWYVLGIGVPRDGRKAIVYGEAAFVQGSKIAARYLAYVYREGVRPVEKNENVARYWGEQAKPNLTVAQAEALEREYPELTGRLGKLDPWDIR